LPVETTHPGSTERMEVSAGSMTDRTIKKTYYKKKSSPPKNDSCSAGMGC
jgi:hypothetical protein